MTNFGAPVQIELREAERHAAPFDVHVKAPGVRLTGRIENISKKGCRACFNAVRLCEGERYLADIGIYRNVEVIVAWTKDCDAGLAFVRPFDAWMVDTVRAAAGVHPDRVRPRPFDRPPGLIRDR